MHWLNLESEELLGAHALEIINGKTRGNVLLMTSIHREIKAAFIFSNEDFKNE